MKYFTEIMLAVLTVMSLILFFGINTAFERIGDIEAYIGMPIDDLD